MRYNENGIDVLQNVSFTIQPGQKVGIVGRTGAGKSSILNCLFRIFDVSNGSVTVDDVDVRDIGLHELRHSIAAILQDPVILSGTVRSNLDPFNEHNDADIWDALSSVHLEEHVTSLGGLEVELGVGGDQFSAGQKQLLCFTRSLLQDTNVVMLDEATSSVDNGMDGLIQESLRRSGGMGGRTVLTIAHRLRTVMDYDMILVMKDGCVESYGPPAVLLGLVSQPESNSGGSELKQISPTLCHFVDQTGEEKQHLYSMARKAYSSSHPISFPVQPLLPGVC